MTVETLILIFLIIALGFNLWLIYDIRKFRKYLEGIKYD